MKNKKYIVYLVVSILVLTIGVSYAYFRARVSGEGKSISLRSKGIYVLYSGDATLASESISPGWSVTKEFTVENQGSNNEVYNIYIEGLVNTFVTSGYLQYKITSSNGYNMSEYKDIPKSNTSTDTVLAYSVPIKSKEKQTYKVELIYKETEEDQSVDMGKILSGILGIQVGTKDPKLFTASIVVINGSSDTNSKEVYKGNDVTFTITPNDGYTLENASINCSNGTLSNNLLTISNVQSDITCTITLNSALPTLAQAMLRDNTTIKERTDFSVTNTATTTGTLYKTNKTEDGSDVYYYSGNTTNNWVKFGKANSCTYKGKDVYYSPSSNYHKNTGNISKEECLSTNVCIYEDSVGNLIYSVGESESQCTVNNNYSYSNDKATFTESSQNIYWRIIRTNEDESVRLLYAGTYFDTTVGYIALTKYNSLTNNPMYVGYMYGTSGSLVNNRTNINDSMVKKEIDEWYKNNLLTNYDKYLSKTAIYCNDRSVGNGIYSVSSSFDYALYTYRIIKHIPTYKCGGNGTGGLIENIQAIEDKFSASTEGGGNGQLKYPTALITADELSFAGGLYGSSSVNVWYYNNSAGNSVVRNQSWWTMSPSDWSGNYVEVWSESGADSFPRFMNYSVVSDMVIRPVISISKCAKVKSGNGTPESPYEMDENSCSK